MDADHVQENLQALSPDVGTVHDLAAYVDD